VSPNGQPRAAMAPSGPMPGGYTANAYPPISTPGAPGYTTMAFPPNGQGPSGGGVAPSQEPFSLKDYVFNKNQKGGTSRFGNAMAGLGQLGGGAGAGGLQPPSGPASVPANTYTPPPLPASHSSFDPMALLKQLGLI
jgi:hypothetical protein